MKSRPFFSSEQQRYAVMGAAFGFIFPVFATFYESNALYSRISWELLLTCQRESELLWIIDTAPFFLAVFASFGGRQLDLVQRKNAELNKRYDELTELRKAADAANKAKSDFLANMSHEIRTPMNAILGMNYLVQRTDLSEKQLDYMRKIEVSSKSLLRIIDDILDFSKIEAGKMQLELSPFEIEQTLMRIADEVNITLSKKREVELISRIDPHIPAVILGDATRLHQVLLNLTENAAKFTERGEIRLSARVNKMERDTITLAFEVTDTGIGMSVDQLERIFTAFEQADVSTTRRFGGSGLGLSISKRIVEMMNGQLNAVSSLGHGSSFSFTADFKLPHEEKTLDRKAHHQREALKALLVDDSEHAREVLSEMLESFGFEVTQASNSAQALESFQSHVKGNTPFSVIILDWQMPGMNGLELAEHLRSGNHKLPAIIMVTAYEELNNKESTKNKAIDDLLLKPVQPSVFFDVLNKHLDLNPASNSVEFPEALDIEEIRGVLKGKKVLLAEDNDLNRELAVELLEDAGMVVSTARNGIEAISEVERNSFDCVLMDIQMPEMDGLTAARHMRKNERNAMLPILAMTAHAIKGEDLKSLAAGMNEHITKPIDPSSLYRLLVKHVQGKETQMKRYESEPLPYAIEGLQLRNGLLRINNKRSSYEKLLKSYALVYSNILTEIEQFLQDANLKLLSGYLHALSGITGSIGAEDIHNRLITIMAELQSASQFNELPQPVIDELLSIAREISQLTARIEQVLSNYSVELDGKRPIDDKTLGEKWSDLIVRAASNDKSSIQLAEDLLSLYSLDMETGYRLKQFMNAAKTSSLENARQFLSLE